MFDMITFVVQRGAVLGCLFIAVLFVQRLYWHPLSKFPGPRLAAITGWYEAYHEAVLGGTFVRKYSMWHQRYGDHYKAPSTAILELNIHKVPSFESLQTTCISASQNFIMSTFASKVIIRSLDSRRVSGYSMCA